jgi:hypothetical protein
LPSFSRWRALSTNSLEIVSLDWSFFFTRGSLRHGGTELQVAPG